MNRLSLLFLFLLSPLTLAQGGPPTGQLPAQDLYVGFAALAPNPMNPNGFIIPAPQSEHIIGQWSATGPNLPAEVLDAALGLVAMVVPAGQPYVIGYDVGKPLYTTSPAQNLQDFGPRFRNPVPLAPQFNPPGISTQWLHLSDSAMWMQIGGDPADLRAWYSFGSVAPFQPGSSTAFITPFGGGGKLFNRILPLLPQIPPATGPMGGSLIGVNLVMQVGVLDPNASGGGYPKFRLSNAIGIQVLAVPAIKINIEPGNNGSNFGPAGAIRHLRVSPATASFRVQLPNGAGVLRSVPTTVLNGETVAYEITPGSQTGQIGATAAGAPVQFEQPLITVVTEGNAQPWVPGQTPNYTVRVADGQPIVGSTVTASIPPGTHLVDVPHPTILSGGAFDVEVEVYPLDGQGLQAGYGSTLPLNLAIQPQGFQGIPFTIGTPPVSLAPNAIRLERFFANQVGNQEIVIENNTNQTMDVLVVVRLHPHQP